MYTRISKQQVKKNSLLAATTSVRQGGLTTSKSQTSEQRKKEVRKSIGQALAKTGNKGTKVVAVPKRVITRRTDSNLTYRSVHVPSSGGNSGYSGIEISGDLFLTDIISPNLTGTGSNILTRIVDLRYLHPSMIVGRASIIASTFLRYKFTRIGLTYLGERGSDEVGDVYMAYIPDPDVDPTILQDRQLKYWYDSVHDHYRGSVFTLKPGTMSVKLNSDLKRMNTDSTTLNDVYQGKICIALTGTAERYIGEVAMHFSMILVDDEVSVGEIQTNVSSTQVTPLQLQIPAVAAAGQDLPACLLSGMSARDEASMPPGVFSIQAKSENPTGTSQNFLNKLYNYGSEFIGALLGKPGLTGRSLTLFNSIADLVTGQPTKSGTAGFGVQNAVVRAIPLLYQNNGRGSPLVGTGIGSFTRTAGWKIAMMNHVKLFSDDCFDEFGNCYGVKEWISMNRGLPHVYSPGNVDIRNYVLQLNQARDQERTGEVAPNQLRPISEPTRSPSISERYSFGTYPSTPK